MSQARETLYYVWLSVIEKNEKFFEYKKVIKIAVSFMVDIFKDLKRDFVSKKITSHILSSMEGMNKEPVYFRRQQQNVLPPSA
jgi:hypothetical protein